jgi:hypothetical protein
MTPKQLFPHKIMWLASYPKSGNTWMRAFLTALMDDGKVELNKMKSDGIFSSRATFDEVTGIDSRYLYTDEAKCMLADVYRRIAANRDHLSIIKVHDAFEQDNYGRNIIPEDVSQCAVYFVRNPLDIAGSLAGHMKISIEDAVTLLIDENARLAKQPDNRNKSYQLEQHLSDWSTHVRGWTNLPSFPVFTVRYEDMLTNTIETFSSLLQKIGWQYSPVAISEAIAASGFEALKAQEQNNGFAENAVKGAQFFRLGKAGNWVNELNTQQIAAITEKHKEVMQKYGYL